MKSKFGKRLLVLCPSLFALQISYFCALGTAEGDGVWDKLKSLGMFENTIIAISADHGIELLEHGTATHGYCPYDEVVKIPFAIYLGKTLPKPKVIDSQGRIFDIGPTLLDLVNIARPKTWGG